MSPSPSRILHPLLGAILPERRSLVDEYFTDVGRIVEQDHIVHQDAVVGRAAELSQVFKQADRIAGFEEFVEEIEGQVHAQARRIAIASAANDGRQCGVRRAGGEVLSAHGSSLAHFIDD